MLHDFHDDHTYSLGAKLTNNIYQNETPIITYFRNKSNTLINNRLDCIVSCHNNINA